jgi:hypothetical protein
MPAGRRTFQTVEDRKSLPNQKAPYSINDQREVFPGRVGGRAFCGF